jgi:superfamily II DNA/RNA helicase
MKYLLFIFVELLLICKYEFRAWTFLSPSRNSYYSNSAWSSRPNDIQRRRRRSWSRRRSPSIHGNGRVVVFGLGNNDDDDEVFSSLEHLQTVRNTLSLDSIRASSTNNSQPIGLNELQTLLREAVATENYREAARLRDSIAETLSSQQTKTKDDDPRKFQRLSWVGLGTAPWLVDRLEALNYILPTTIQIHAFESINEMLLKQMNQTTLQQPQHQTLEELVDAAASASSYYYDSDSQPARKRTNMAVIVSGSTGSGKTLAYLVPLLSTLSESLFERQRIRVKAESDVVDAADDLLSRVAIQTSPEVRGRSNRPMVNAAAARVPLSMGKSGRDVTSPLALIVVPSRELGIQTAMTLYELVGGSTKRTPTEFSGKRNMFKFKGPRGVKISCILDDIEAESGLTMQTDVAITTPQYLTKLLHDKQIKPERLRVVVYDEADLALETTKEEDLKLLFQSTDTSNNKNGMDQEDNEEEEEDDYLDHSHSSSRLTYLVGASVTDSLQQIPPVREHVLQKDYTYLATATSFAPVVFEDDVTSQDTDELEASSLSQLKLHLDPGLIHERVVAPNHTRLLCLSRLLRKELQEYSRMANTTTTSNEAGMKKKISSPRVVIFFPNEEEAKECMPKLRDAMWGDYKLCVLLPNTGVSPLTVMEDFKSNKTSVMLATANSIRGLDFEG